ncbi:MAG: hypothetical protein ACTS4Z_00455 [Candidatus Hodgkinia cicadicola]
MSTFVILNKRKCPPGIWGLLRKHLLIIVWFIKQAKRNLIDINGSKTAAKVHQLPRSAAVWLM